MLKSRVIDASYWRSLFFECNWLIRACQGGGGIFDLRLLTLRCGDGISRRIAMVTNVTAPAIAAIKTYTAGACRARYASPGISVKCTTQSGSQCRYGCRYSLMNSQTQNTAKEVMISSMFLLRRDHSIADLTNRACWSTLSLI